MRTRLGWIAALLLLISQSGCGTMMALSSDRYDSLLYCGVREDVEGLSRKYHGMGLWWFFVPDFPFSLALDTVFLPGTLIYEIFRSPSEDKAVPARSEPER
jgi:uncharacterized protein YceK